jgi:monovalent cation:H+ antiporter, CPA1 family
MSLFNMLGILITLAALFSYLNYKYFKLPTSIGIMVIAMACSLALIGLGSMGFGIKEHVEHFLQNIDFNKVLLHGMLGFLLFAGALHININDLKQEKWIIITLATVGVVASTFIVGGASYLILNMFNVEVPIIYCLIFGSLISPTDPIAVIGILKTAGAPKSLETKIAGESLFNDGVGVVVFIVLLDIALGGHQVTPTSIALLFIEEAFGGISFGFVLGIIGYWLLKNVDNYQVEVLITLALVMGGYALSEVIHTSGAIAMAVSGLIIGNHGRAFAMSEKTREHLDNFWELIDEILNAVLFVLIGMEILVIGFSSQYVMVGLLMIPTVLLVRFLTVLVPVKILSFRREFSPNAVKIMTWGGLRGGISVALALSLPPSQIRDIILVITYIIVVFSIIVQGLTIGKLIKA